MTNISAIVCLGLGLHPDGSMDKLLVERCKVASNLHKERGIPIINTGGDTRMIGRSESAVMADFMVESLGVERSQILSEEEAHNTKTNAVFTFKIIEGIQRQLGKRKTITFRKLYIVGNC